jgi:hypothetical protein
MFTRFLIAAIPLTGLPVLSGCVVHEHDRPVVVEERRPVVVEKKEVIRDRPAKVEVDVNR